MTPREHRLPGFVELAELGAGAQGEVVLARHESGGGPVAIKYLAVNLLGNTEARNTFRTEAEMLKRVVNPHVAWLLDYLESPWGAAIVLEAVAGLRKVLDEHDGPFTPEAALTTLKGSLLGLAAAHAVGIQRKLGASNTGRNRHLGLGEPPAVGPHREPSPRIRRPPQSPKPERGLSTVAGNEDTRVCGRPGRVRTGGRRSSPPPVVLVMTPR